MEESGRPNKADDESNGEGVKYAANTSVSVERSRAEIESILSKYGANKFAYFSEDTKACIAFEISGKRIRFLLPLPDKREDQFKYRKHYSSRKLNTPGQQHGAWEQACRQRWRALALAVKAKLEWVETGIVTVEEEFLPYIVTANGKTVAEMVMPQLEELYQRGFVPRLLPENVS